MNFKPSFRTFVLLLLCTLFLQSCRTYQSRVTTTEDAVLVAKRFKLKTTSNETYKFENLLKEDGNIIGVAKRNSKTAVALADKIITKDATSKYVKILLPEDFISEIHLENKTGSIIGSIFGIAALGILAGIGFLLIIFS